MVSNSSKTYLKRRRKQSTGGKARKKTLDKQGSTPKFPIRPEGEPKGQPKAPTK